LKPRRKPACSSRYVASTASRSIIRQKTLPGTDSRVIPRQLLQSPMLPFFGSFMITPFVQSSGTHFSFQQLFMRLVSAQVVPGPPCFSNSADISSSPTIYCFKCLNCSLRFFLRYVGNVDRQVFGYGQRIKSERYKS